MRLPADIERVDQLAEIGGVKKAFTVSIYAIAMAYVESAVVVYLRQMIFGSVSEVFPMKYLQPNFALIEVGREAATVIMLLAVGLLAGRNKLQKWMFFIYAFALWDIFYYVFLKLMIGWPSSLLSFDILFLIPVAWIGPVLTPVLISILLGAGSLALINLADRSDEVRIGGRNSWVFAAGCFVVLYSFTGKIFHILFSVGPKGLGNYAPTSFDWIPFLAGYLLMCAAVVKIISDSYRRIKREKVIQ
ncbi:MAG: hypothetical protein M1395_04065 [Bacteroidetes bacterium]|nr:hypothetical protein [Bacteroidota bacterium]